ncbi:MAG: hypothetical protein ACYTFK_14735 [Planctomycetota bacterium]
MKNKIEKLICVWNGLSGDQKIDVVGLSAVAALIMWSWLYYGLQG